ncbi:MAG: SDR family NAD(P)-dependent oxidoreductase [Oscillospiraceae bacterium]
MEKIVLLTGGSSGIGRCAARRLADAGCRVYELSRRDSRQAGITHLPCDVTRQDQVEAAVQTVVDREGRIDIVVNNAGFGISGAVEFTDTEDARRLLDVNFFGMVRVNRAVLPHLRRAGGGRIVNLSSVAAVAPIPFQTYYSASKAAVKLPIPWPWPMKCAPSASPSAPSSREISPRASPPPGRSPRPATGSTAAASAGPWPGWSGTRKPAWRRKPQAPFSAG